MQKHLWILLIAGSILPFLLPTTLSLLRLVSVFVGRNPSQFLLAFLLPLLTCLFLPQSPFRFSCHFLPPNHLRPNSILGSYAVALLRDPLAYCRWALCTFIVYILSCRQVFRPWHIVAYYLASELALLSFSSSTSTTLSSQALGRPRCPPIWGQRCLAT